MSGTFANMSDSEFRGIVFDAMKHPHIQFILNEMSLMGCKVDRRFVHVEDCDEKVGGGFRPPDGIVLCKNRLQTRSEVKNTLQHELIHAYDHCRAKNLDWSDCEMQACSEIRAAALSGDCQWKFEFLRGKLSGLGVVGNGGHFQKCLRRRAELSVSMKPHCRGARARDAVSAVFPECFRDTAPFPPDKYP
ncbi:unnamed protein product [Pedinophyceae sp. YPF-701]|nr:unnamed protein product [Pedinophyceae sp. YPF-701]